MYMKIFKKFLFACLFLGGFNSCDFLDKEPTQLVPEVYFNTQEDAEAFLKGVYATLAQSDFYGSKYIDIAGGDDLCHWGGPGRKPTNSVICNRVTTSDTGVTNLWKNLYMGINRANMFLENIDRVEINDELKRQYVAEVRFLRAYFYFILVQNWGDVPFHDTSTQTVIGLDIPQTNRQTLYEFIISEMDYAAENGLKSAAELSYHPGHVSKSAAWGILARVYMFRAGEHYREKRPANDDENYTYFFKANEYAMKVKGEGHGLVDLYGDFFIDLCSGNYNTKANESIWEIEFAGNNTTDVKAGGAIGQYIGLGGPDYHTQSQLVGKADPGYAYSAIYATPLLHDYYVEDNDKERFYWNIAPFSYQSENANTGVTGRQFVNGRMDEYMEVYGDRGFSYGESTKEKVGDYEYVDYHPTSKDLDKGKCCAKYRREFEPDKKDKNATAINFPALRYSDVLLMIAETENEIHETPTDWAYQCLNDVRRRAGVAEIKNLDKESFREVIKKERAMELCFEMTRRYDLIRWGDFVTNMNALVDRARQGNVTGEWKMGATDVYTYFQVTDVLNYLPIPEIELSVNKKIVQNPGY